MSKLIFADFDLTLINRNLERDFLIHLFRTASEYRPLIIFNALLHIFIKYFKKITGQRNNLKYYYKGFQVKYIEESLYKFIKERNHTFLWNESILDMIKPEKDTLVILTRSPKFMSKMFCDLNFSKIKWKLYGSTLSIKDEKFTGSVKFKLNNKFKKLICDYEMSKAFDSSLITKGFGDSKDDIDFLKIVDEPYGVSRKICNNNFNVKYLKPTWKNFCSL